MLCILHLLTWAVLMGSCSQMFCIIPHCVHFLLILTCSTVPALAPFTIKAKLHQSVDLICKQECPGTLKWVTDNQPDDVLAQCDQTSCRSKEGYIISHEEYKTGSLSLTVMEADYSKRVVYACECNAEDLCHVWLCLEPERSSVELKPGEDLLLDLPVPEPVEVIYNSSDLFGPQYEQICTVVGGSLQCKDEYRGRVSLRYPSLLLKSLNVSDSGVYIVRDMKNSEDIHVYGVSVKDMKKTNTSLKVLCGLVGTVILVGVTVAIIVYLKTSTMQAKDT